MLELHLHMTCTCMCIHASLHTCTHSYKYMLRQHYAQHVRCSRDVHACISMPDMPVATNGGNGPVQMHTKPIVEPSLEYMPVQVLTKNEEGCRDDTMPKTSDTRRPCEVGL